MLAANFSMPRKHSFSNCSDKTLDIVSATARHSFSDYSDKISVYFYSASIHGLLKKKLANGEKKKNDLQINDKID